MLLLTTKVELTYVVACIMQVDVKEAGEYTGRIGKAITSKIVAAGATTGALGLVSLFGTAGTGTAIASLSGAAATNATLAWVGGLVGGGMAAGTLLTGGLAILVSMGVYSFLGEDPRKEETLAKINKQIIETCSILIKAIEDQFSESKEIPDSTMSQFYKLSLQPLYRLMKDNEDDIRSRLNMKNSIAFGWNALSDFNINIIKPYRKNYLGK